MNEKTVKVEFNINEANAIQLLLQSQKYLRSDDSGNIRSYREIKNTNLTRGGSSTRKPMVAAICRRVFLVVGSI